MSQLNVEDIQKEMMMDLVDSLPKLRKRLKISQTDLGEKDGLSRQTISSIERNTTPLTWNNYLAIMMFFTANSEDVFYFPRKSREYKYMSDFARIMIVNEEIKRKGAELYAYQKR